MINSETSRSVLLKKFVLRSVIVTLLKGAYKWNSFFSIFDIFFSISYFKTDKLYYKYYERCYEYYKYYERYYKILRVVLRDTKRWYKWYYETLRGTTSGTMSHYEILRVVLQDTARYYGWYYESLCGTKRHFERFSITRRVVPRDVTI